MGSKRTCSDRTRLSRLLVSVFLIQIKRPVAVKVDTYFMARIDWSYALSAAGLALAVGAIFIMLFAL